MQRKNIIEPRMERDKDIRKELEGIAPGLSKLEKWQPEDVPYGYFDRSKREILMAVRESSKMENQSIQSRLLAMMQQLTKPAFGLPVGFAATILIIAGIWLNLPNSGSGETEVHSAQDISTEAAISYVEHRLYEFEPEQIAMSMDEEELDALFEEILMEEFEEDFDFNSSESQELFNDRNYENLF